MNSRFLSKNIPAFLDIPVIDMNTGKFTDEWKVIMQQLLDRLQAIIGNEGLVAPSQDATNISTIVTNQVQAPQGVTPTTIFTCQFGTILYNTDANTLIVALKNLITGAPEFHQILTA